MKITTRIRKNLLNHWEIWLSGFLGAVIFLIIYGPKVLIPSNVDYLMIGGDLSQHYLGWELYRHSPLRLFIGKTNALAYPYSTSVIFTDSIPLFSVIFKLIIPDKCGPFQFFGIWSITCFILQGIFAARLIKRRVSANGITGSVTVLILSLLFILCPFFIKRIFWHSALAGQFIILMSLDLLDRTISFSRVQLVVHWIFIGILCSFIHLYFLAMCGAILMASCLYRFMQTYKSVSIPKAMIDFITPILGFIFFAWYSIFVLGGFDSNMAGGAPGLGYYSFNLNGFINADENYSRILPSLSYYEAGQYEGNAYLGMGVLILVALSIIILIVNITKTKKITSKPSVIDAPLNPFNRSYLISVSLLVIALLLISASNELTIGNHLIYNIPLGHFIEKIYSPFRSSGRLIWPVGYIIILGAIRIVFSNVPSGNTSIRLTNIYKYAVVTIAVTASILQIYDLSGKLSSIHNDFANLGTYTNPIATDSDLLPLLVSELTIQDDQLHLVFFNKDSLSQEELYAFADFAVSNNMTINDFYFARFFKNRGKEIALEYAKSGRTDCLYVCKESELNKYEALPLHFYKENGFVYAITKRIN